MGDVDPVTVELTTAGNGVGMAAVCCGEPSDVVGLNVGMSVANCR